jgi:homoserine O-acetyltransferase
MIQDVVTIDESSSIEDAARVMMEKGVTHLPVISAERRLAGIVTAWDVSKAVAMKYTKLEEIMTRDVVTSDPGDAIDTAARKMDFNNISALPVLGEDGRLVGLVTGDGISRLISICK